jgi:hypothetical protein
MGIELHRGGSGALYFQWKGRIVYCSLELIERQKEKSVRLMRNARDYKVAAAQNSHSPPQIERLDKLNYLICSDREIWHSKQGKRQLVLILISFWLLAPGQGSKMSRSPRVDFVPCFNLFLTRIDWHINSNAPNEIVPWKHTHKSF